MPQKRGRDLETGDKIIVGDVPITVERLESIITIVWFGPRFPGFPDGENSFGCGGDEMFEVVEE